MNTWLAIFYTWLVGIPVVMVVIWVLDQAYMAGKKWGIRNRGADALIASVAWPIVVVLAPMGYCASLWEKLWYKQFLFKKKEVKKCNRGLRSDEV